MIIIAPKDRYFKKTMSNMQVIARGGKFFITDNKKTLNENIRFGFRVLHLDIFIANIINLSLVLAYRCFIKKM